MTVECFEKTTKEQKEAIKIAEQEADSIGSILRDVATSIPSEVPEDEVEGYRLGSCTAWGKIGECYTHQLINENFPSDTNLSEIKVVGLYRQSVLNKYTKERKIFYVTVPLEFAGTVKPGDRIHAKKSIAIGTKREEVEEMARESFLKLQELVKEFHNLKEKEMFDYIYKKATPEQKEALKKIDMDKSIIYTIHRVAMSIPSEVPKCEIKVYSHGASTTKFFIGGIDVRDFQEKEVPSDIDLSDIREVGIYRQAVRNKYTNVRRVFCSFVPLGFCGEITPGEDVDPETKGIPIGTKIEEVESLARESFLKLQEYVKGFYEEKESVDVEKKLS